MTERGEMKAKIVEAFKENPDAKNKEIMELTGANASYVSRVRSELGLTPKDRVSAVYLKKAVRFKLDEENYRWFYAECKRLNLTPQELINALITDARLEEE